MIARIAPPWVTARTVSAGSRAMRSAAALDAVEEAAQAFAAGEGEVELEGRPAIDQRRLLGLQVLEAVVFPAAEVDLAQIAVDLHAQAGGNRRGRLPAAPQGAAKAALRVEPPDGLGQGAGLLVAGRVQGRVAGADQASDVCGPEPRVPHQDEAMGHRRVPQQKKPVPRRGRALHNNAACTFPRRNAPKRLLVS